MSPISARTLLLSSAVLLSAVPAQAVNWFNQGYSPGIDGFNPQEKTISAANVQNLALAWQSSTTDINGVYGLVEDNGTIFVLSEDPNGNGDVVALNGSTGAELWKAASGYSLSNGFSGLAAASGRVFAPCAAGSQFEGICAYSQKTGKSVWSANFYEQGISGDFGGAIERPTVAGGVVYVSETMCDPHVTNCDSFWAIDAKNGGIIWGAQAPASGYDEGGPVLSPAVSTGTGLMYVPCSYVFNGNNDDSFSGLCTFGTSNGAGGWQYGLVNADGGVAGVSISGNTVFFQQASDVTDEQTDIMTALNASSGSALWSLNFVFSFHDAVQPTVAKNVVYWPDGNGTLWALKEKTGATVWSFGNWPNGCSPVGGANGTESQPQVVNGVVFITTSCFQSGFHDATTFALSASNGTILWSGAGGTNYASGGDPVIVNGELYTDCYEVCAYSLPKGSRRTP